jgi:hypothetical protein
MLCSNRGGAAVNEFLSGEGTESAEEKGYMKIISVYLIQLRQKFCRELLVQTRLVFQKQLPVIPHVQVKDLLPGLSFHLV